ncbi:hypothetical protein SBADM41S_02914 [Streptomyces badius]
MPTSGWLKVSGSGKSGNQPTVYMSYLQAAYSFWSFVHSTARTETLKSPSFSS